jgi:carbamoyl-phosphate synthase large subunit
MKFTLKPLTARTVKRIIEKERPDSLLASMGGQTGLTIAMQLHKEGFLNRMGVRLIGTNAEAIDKAEDRQLFKETMLSIGLPYPLRHRDGSGGGRPHCG